VGKFLPLNRRDQAGAHQPEQGRSVGKDADPLAAATDFAIETLKRVGGPDLAAMLERKTMKG
jgi:hypothetical protein